MFEDYFSIDELRKLIPSATTAEAYDKVLDTVYFALHPVLNDKDKKYLRHCQDRSGKLKEYYRNNDEEFMECWEKNDCLGLFESIFNKLGGEGNQLLEEFLEYRVNPSIDLGIKLVNNKKGVKSVLRDVMGGIMRYSDYPIGVGKGYGKAGKLLFYILIADVLLAGGAFNALSNTDFGKNPFGSLLKPIFEGVCMGLVYAAGILMLSMSVIIIHSAISSHDVGDERQYTSLLKRSIKSHAEKGLNREIKRKAKKLYKHVLEGVNDAE